MLTLEDREQFHVILPEIRNRLLDFARIPQQKWMREVALCLLTPQSSPVSAESAITQLEEEGFFNHALSEQRIAEILRHPTGGGYVRFHITKAKRLMSFLNIQKQIEDLLTGPEKGICERNTLRDLVKGFGLKEASHALRNIGRKNLSILDRHILRCLEAYQVIEPNIKNLNEKNYLSIEQRFLRFAEDNQTTIDELDLFFWWKATGFIYK